MDWNWEFFWLGIQNTMKNAVFIALNLLFQVQEGQIRAKEAPEFCGVYMAILTLDGSPIPNFCCILNYFLWKILEILRNALFQLLY